MGLDIRWPIGGLFSLIGLMMLVFGAVTSSNAELYKRSLGINVNICWGSVLVVFGFAMLGMAWRAAKMPLATAPAADKK